MVEWQTCLNFLASVMDCPEVSQMRFHRRSAPGWSSRMPGSFLHSQKETRPKGKSQKVSHLLVQNGPCAGT